MPCYWKYLKGKMAKEGIQLVSVNIQFKFIAPDSKQRSADALDDIFSEIGHQL